MRDSAMKLSSGCYFGKTLRECRVTELLLTETAYVPNSRLQEHSHEVAYFCFVLQGAYAETYRTKTQQCIPSTLIFHPQNDHHSNWFYDTGGRCFSIEIDSLLLERVKEYSKLPDNALHFQGGLVATYVMKLYREFCEMDGFSRLSIEGLTLEMLAETSRQAKRETESVQARWLREVIEILHSRFSETLTLNDLSNLVNRHPVHIAREFRSHYGCTVGEYIRQLRIDLACTQLSKTKNPLSEIAVATGFSQQSHFSSTFKRLMGVSPSKYRKNSR